MGALVKGKLTVWQDLEQAAYGGMSAFQADQDFLGGNCRPLFKSGAAGAVFSVWLKRTTAPENLMGLQSVPSGRGG